MHVVQRPRRLDKLDQPVAVPLDDFLPQLRDVPLPQRLTRVFPAAEAAFDRVKRRTPELPREPTEIVGALPQRHRVAWRQVLERGGQFDRLGQRNLHGHRRRVGRQQRVQVSEIIREQKRRQRVGRQPRVRAPLAQQQRDGAQVVIQRARHRRRDEIRRRHHARDLRSRTTQRGEVRGVAEILRQRLDGGPRRFRQGRRVPGLRPLGKFLPPPLDPYPVAEIVVQDDVKFRQQDVAKKIPQTSHPARASAPEKKPIVDVAVKDELARRPTLVS